MKEDLTIAVPEGGLQPVTDLKGLPVPEEEVIENIKSSVQFDIPLLERCHEPQEGSYIFVAGGTSLTFHLDEIKERKKNGELIATSNNTHDFLVDNGIIPDICSDDRPEGEMQGLHKETSKRDTLPYCRGM